MSLRIVIADDHAVVRAGLERLLAAAGMDVVGTAEDGLGAVEIATLTNPDVVLMDLSMPRLDGIAATRRLLATRPATRVVMLTSFSDRDRVLGALDAGAIGYLLKDAPPDALVRGLEAAARGEAPLAPLAARAVLDARRDRRSEPALTDRERQVLLEVSEGWSNKEIAWRLGITEKTVKSHLTSIFARLGVDDRVSAAMWAERHGLTHRSDGGSAQGDALEGIVSGR
jgi:DNA-binding NarL/FixJ family response regulator